MSGAPRSDRGFEVLEHTADVGLRVWAPTLPELLSEAAVRLVGVMGTAEGPPTHRETVLIQAPDLDALLVDWLSEVLYLFEVRGLVPATVRVHAAREDSGWRLDATLEGPGAEGFEQRGPAVKAVTYHGIEVREAETGWEARVYLDV